MRALRSGGSTPTASSSTGSEETAIARHVSLPFASPPACAAHCLPCPPTLDLWFFTSSASCWGGPSTGTSAMVEALYCLINTWDVWRAGEHESAEARRQRRGSDTSGDVHSQNSSLSLVRGEP